MRLFLVPLLLFILPSCAMVHTVGASAQIAVAIYCAAPQEVRLTNRALVDNVVTPNKIAITCIGDV